MADPTEKPSQHQEDADTEFEAMRRVYAALKDLDAEAQNRVLDYVLGRLGLTRRLSSEQRSESFNQMQQTRPRAEAAEAVQSLPPEDDQEEFAGISAVAKKWMRRNGLSPEQLSAIYSLGLDEIDLVAANIPGESTKDRMRSAILLQGIASYLSTGAARISDQKVKEVCGHYNAYDGTNFSKYIRSMAAEVSGNRDSGYTLTNRGLAAAAEVIKSMSG